MNGSADNNLLQVLFDMSFTEFITTRVIKFLYLLGIIIMGIVTLVGVFGSFKSGFFFGIGSLIVAPFLFCLYVVFIRMWFELIVVIFRIAENTGRMANQGRM